MLPWFADGPCRGLEGGSRAGDCTRLIVALRPRDCGWWIGEKLMTSSEDRSAKMMRGLRRLLADQSSTEFVDFVEVAESLMDGYAKLISKGSPASTVALAMLGATLNLYEMLGMRAELPDLLRSVADQIESDGRVN